MEILRNQDGRSQAAQDQLEKSGRFLALTSRVDWIVSVSPHAGWLLLIRDATGTVQSGCAVSVIRSRVLPGFASLRVERLGGSVRVEDAVAVVAALAQLARAPNILRLNVEVFTREPELREALATALSEQGFYQEPMPRGYRDTAVIDLRPEPSQILAGFSKTARSNLRSAEKARIEV